MALPFLREIAVYRCVYSAEGAYLLPGRTYGGCAAASLKQLAKLKFALPS